MAAESFKSEDPTLTLVENKSSNLGANHPPQPRLVQGTNELQSPWGSLRLQFLLKGIVFGLVFPVAAAVVAHYVKNESFWDTLLFQARPEMYITMLAPLVLGTLGYYFGRSMELWRTKTIIDAETVRDKTKMLEKSLNEIFADQQRYQNFTDLLPFGAIFVEDNTLTMNPRAETLTGYRKSEITSVTDWFQLLHPKDAAVQKKTYMEDRLSGFTNSCLSAITKRNGHHAYLEISRQIDAKGEVWILNDITHQLEIQNEGNIKSEILEKTSDGILILDEDLKIVSQNKASEQRSGPLRRCDFILLIPESKRLPFEKQVFAELRTNRFWHGQTELLDEHGDEFPALLRLFAHFDAIAQKSFYSAIITDLSELEMERYKSIQTAKLASIGELSAGVGHEINNPLAILRGIYEQCLRLVKKEAPYEKIQQQLEKQESALDRITKIVDALRIYARGEKMQFEQISVHQGIRDTLNLVEAMFVKQGIEIVSNLDATNDIILGSLGQIQQVIMNLLSNARDAVEHSEIKRVTIQTRNESSDFVLSVSDTGCGMDEKTKQKMFQPFFTTKARGKGTGMGTSISLGIIRNHNGKFDFESKVNEGSTFWFKIKTADQASNGASNESAEGNTSSDSSIDKASKKQRPQILIVDDEPEIREVLRFILEKAGAEVAEAEDGMIGLQAVKQKQYDAIVCDIQMPVLDGIGMYNDLKKDPSFKGKFILITGGIQTNRSSKNHHEFMDSIDGFLRKPFTDDELIELLRNLQVLQISQEG